MTVNGADTSNGENASGGSAGTCDDTIGGAGAGGSIYLIVEMRHLIQLAFRPRGASTYISQSGVTTGMEEWSYSSRFCNT